MDGSTVRAESEAESFDDLTTPEQPVLAPPPIDFDPEQLAACERELRSSRRRARLVVQPSAEATAWAKPSARPRAELARS